MQSVVVESILWQGRHGGAVFNACTIDGTHHRIVAGAEVMSRPPVVGEVWEIEGVIRQHSVHGRQVQVRSAALQKPSGRLVVAVLAGSPDFPGIGAARATALWDTFGEELYDLLATGEPGPFEAALGQVRARALVKGWAKLKEETTAYRWLDAHGLQVWLSKKLLAIYGSELVAKLEENVYRLLAFTSWTQADKVGRAMGFAANDPKRLVAGFEAAHYQRLSSGHTWTPSAQLYRLASRLLGADENTTHEAIKVAESVSAVVRVGEGLQGLGPFSMERFIVARVRSMLDGDFQAMQMTIRQEPTQDHLDKIFEDFLARTGLSLNPEQREGVRLAVTNTFACLTGGAGVGKTTVLKAVHMATESLGFSGIYQMALSGRAAKRMAEATGRPASTIAAFLKGIDTGRISLEGEFLLIVDEASMLDLPHCYRIMRRMTPGTRLLLVGDAAQLPPIGFGLTFHLLVGNPLIPTVQLTEIHRAAAATGIPQVSVSVRSGEVPVLTPYLGKADGVSFVDTSAESLADKVAEVFKDLGGSDGCQVVSATKRGPAGVHTINNLFHHLLATDSTQLHGFAKMEPVLWGVNDYRRSLFNGSLGRVVDISHGLQVDFDGIVHILDEMDLQNMDLAYAITVHKSQGSQFERVIVPVFPSRLLDRTLLYTAITRASRQVVLIGDRSAFERAVAEPPVSSRRQTGLAHWLQQK